MFEDFKVSEAPHLQSGASRSLIILFRYMPLDPAYKAGLARHETGQIDFSESYQKRLSFYLYQIAHPDKYRN